MGQDAPPKINTHKSQSTGVPPTYIKITETGTNKRAEPKSGCFRMRKSGKPNNARMKKRRPKKNNSTVLLPMYRARANKMANFANSEGWKEKIPILNQRCAPLVDWPRIKTTTRKKIAAQ